MHPRHAVRAAGCWVARGTTLAVEQTSGRQRLNIQGAIDLETGETCMIEAPMIEAASTICLLEGIERGYLGHTTIDVFLDHAGYHHAALMQDWQARSKSRIR